jgi:hypothetical protein
MKFICAQPGIKYYMWQLEVMLHNFRKMGINMNDVHLLLAKNSTEPEGVYRYEEAANLAEEYKCNIFWYEDTRGDYSYIPSIYFNMMKQHMAAHPELLDEALFLHDSDIIFTKPVDFSDMEDDDVWYLSDTVGYIGTQYILTKGEDVLNGMCKVIGIDPTVPKIMNKNSGGGQHITKGATYEYWDKVEKDSIKLYKWFCDTEYLHKQDGREGYPIQKWTAGMWSLLWNSWLFGHETRVDKRLDFCWATDPIERWSKAAIFHNAGVTTNKGYFYKGSYTSSYPYDLKLDVSPKFCTYNYYKHILEVSNTSVIKNVK